MNNQEEKPAKDVPARSFPPGHFYSPIPNLDDIELAIANRKALSDLAGVDLREPEQAALLPDFARYYQELPYSLEAESRFRFSFANPSFSFGDAITLYCMLRHSRPRRVIEIGCGHSSCVTLDTNELFFENNIDCTFIDPYPELLRTLLKRGDAERIKILEARVQDLDPSLFTLLEAGDILFIDSSHVLKAGSDLQTLFFRILPSLQTGVLVHFHDIFPGFEYPDGWLREGRAWNEQYVLRAFLQYNAEFRIKFFTTYMQRRHSEWFAAHMPLFQQKRSGGIWIERCGLG